jgi:RNA polymerase sigma-70 factor (TIGR02960 family)
VPGVQPPPPTRLGEVAWLEPLPDDWFEGALEVSPGPAARYEQTESISLTFIAALQVLPPRQLAALVLCDVLGFESSEAATMLESSLDSLNSALKRARANLPKRLSPRDSSAVPTAGSAAEAAIVAKFAEAWQSADVDAVVALLTDDVFISMPPIENEYEGVELAARFCRTIFDAGRRFVLLPTRANRQPAFGAYLQRASGTVQGVGVYVLSVRDGGISAMTRFEPSLLERFGLPATLSRR